MVQPGRFLHGPELKSVHWGLNMGIKTSWWVGWNTSATAVERRAARVAITEVWPPPPHARLSGADSGSARRTNEAMVYLSLLVSDRGGSPRSHHSG